MATATASLVLRATALLCAVALSGCSKEPPKQEPELPALGKHGLVLSSWKSAHPDPQDRLLLARAMATGKMEAMVMVATRIGSTPAVATAIAAMGGDIRVRFDEVGYLRVRLPLDRLMEISALPEVLMAHLDGGAPGGLYSQDLDLIQYPLPGAPPITLAAATSDTLLGSDSGEAASLSADIETLLRAANDPQTEMLVQPSIAGRFPEGGADLFALLADRAVEVSGKPMLGSAGHAARVESINGASSGRRALAIGAFANAEILRTHVPFRIPLQEMLAPWSSRGPAADGGAKPDLLAPGNNVDGTSSETTVAAEAVANLMATAKAEKLPADARHISWALRMSARRIDNYQPHEQGFGVMNAERALDLLRQMQSRQFELPDIATRAPVKTYLARFLPEPGVGQGLYEREGWLVGQTDRREITLTRQSGAATPLKYSLQWRGNDGTFKTYDEEIELPLHVPVAVLIEIAPAQAGIHSAQLFLLDQASDLPVHAVMTTVVASEQFSAANGYTIQHRERSLPALRSKRYFLEVSPNVAALRIDLAVGAGQVKLALSTGGPLGASFDLASANKLVAAGQPIVVLVPNPPPGVYELSLLPFALREEFSRSDYEIPSDIEMTASIRYVDTQLAEETAEKNSRTLWMTNIYAPLKQSSIVAAVGAQRILEEVAGGSGMRIYNINVAAGSSSLRVAASATDGKARAGIYLYDCADAGCKLWGSDVFSKTSQKSLVVPDPRAGVWKVVIDVGTAGGAFKYTEIMTSPQFGVAKVGGEDAARRNGARWNQLVSYEPATAVPFGYQPVGVMDVVDPLLEADERAAPYGDWQTTGNARNRPLRPLRLATQVIPLGIPGPLHRAGD